LKRTVRVQSWTDAVAVAFTPKGGCPLKHNFVPEETVRGFPSSIHPQGWVPIETYSAHAELERYGTVAFTPKGGCPLKREVIEAHTAPPYPGSIHPQGWVPIETIFSFEIA